MENKTPKEIFNAIVVAIMVIVFLVIGALIVSSILNISTTNCSPSASSSSSQSLLTQSTATLTPIGEGITSNSAEANNNSWMEFDGVNDFVETNTGDLNLNYSNNFSFSSWVNINSITSADQKNIIHSINSSGSFPYFDLAIRNQSGTQKRFYFRGQFNSTGCDKTAEQIINDEDFFNEWYHVVGSWNGSTLFIYLNGDLNDTTVHSPSCINRLNSEQIGIINPLQIGGNSVFAETTIDAGIDEVRVYNRTLSDAEALEIYNSGRLANSSLPSDGLVLWYSFNEGSGTVVRDKSGLGNDGV